MRHKKANFSIMNAGLLTFISFVLITIMVIVTLSILKGTSMVCGGEPTNASLTLYQGTCYRCAANATTGNLSVFNTTGLTCYDPTSNTTQGNSVLSEYTGAAYNATKELQTASLLPPQFASIIVIVLLIVGILALLAVVGFNVYQKMR